MLSLPNIYSGKNVKYYLAVPLILMAIAIYLWLFSGRFTLDSSLTGGISVLMQTNSTLPTSQISSQIAAALHSQLPTVQRSPGSIEVTINENKSLDSAEAASLDFFAFQQNYTASLLNVTTLSDILKSNSTNKTALTELKQYQSIENNSLSKMSLYLGSELSYLQPFIGSVSVPSDPNQMALLAQGAYSNATTIYTNHVISVLHSVVPFATYSSQQIGPTLGRFFLSQLEGVIIVSFILISIAVFFIFRSPVPAFTVVFGALNDMIIALGAMALFGIPLGTASIGGLLMIVGYSIDTDVLSSYRILKTHGDTPEERAHSSMKTGLTMTATAIVSFSVLFIVSLFTYVPTYYEVAGVALFGLIGDIFTTWLGNTSMILLYKKRKDKI